MRKRRIVELGLVLLCTNLMLVAATVPGQGLRDARSAASATGAMLSRAAEVAAIDQLAVPSATARSVVTPKTQQVQTPNALLSSAPELQASPVASKSQAKPAQTSIVKTEAQPVQQHQQATRAPSNDDCANAITFDLAEGQPVTFCDDNTGATEDCPALSGGVYRDAWYKFTTTAAMNVSIAYCGTTPAFYNAYIVLDTTCPCSGAWIFATTWETTSCGDGNWTLTWNNLPAGTYYWPLLTDSAGGYAEGPYCVTFNGFIPPPPPGCPANTMYGQPPMDQGGAWGAYTSGVGQGFEYTCYDNFTGLPDKIGDLHWWGLSLFFDPYYGWTLCDPTGMVFDIGFYQDNAGQPGTQVAFYPGVAATITDQGPYSWAELYFFSVDALQPCVVLPTGWVSVKSEAHPNGCVFLWLNSPVGDYSSYQQPAGSGFTQLGTDLAMCITTGDCPLIYGACCDDYTGVCNDNVEWGDCMAPLRFTPDTLCQDISPTCGIRGACCDSGLNCIFTGFESECDAAGGRFFPGQTCPEFVCPADCEHRIDLYDCYGDGWNGNTLDVLVNGVTVLSQITLPSGLGPLTYTFMAASGDTIQTVYYPIGGWPYEPYYYIYDGFGSLLGYDGTDGSNCYIQPTGITVTGNCTPPTTGACCYYAGGCDMVPEADCDPALGLFLGLGHQCIECPCFVPCPPEGVPEAEPCGDDTNGGCNNPSWVFEPIDCGETICGTMWANTSLRDTDWYQMTLAEGQYLTWSGASQVPLLLFIIQGAGPNDCSTYSILASATAGECQTATIGPFEGAPGVTYWFWAGPSAWNDWPCDKDYVATLTCAPVPTGACCLPNGTCVETTPSGCATQNGVYQGDYVSCADVVCEQFYCPAGAQICDEYISNVQIDVINNPSGCEAGQYADYTALGPATLPIGVSTPLTVTNGNPIWTADTCSVWIDWNKDYVLDDFAPEALPDIPGVGPYVFDVEPPASTVFEPTRMRIRIDYANADPDPCGTVSYGEVEDYTVVVQEVLGACCWPDGSCTNTLPSECGGYWVGAFTECSGLDCNGNGADDLCDIVSGYSEDCDHNGVPDECQTFYDCNENGVPDFCDIGSGDSLDCNANGIPDECDVPPLCQAGQPGFPDVCSLDCQPDLIPDECQLAGGLNLQLDDGTSENNWGLTAGGELCWINHFTATGDVTNIGVTFGSPAFPGSAGVTPGQEFHVYVWGDSNGDGVPSGADFIASAVGNVDAGSIDTDVVQTVPLNAPISVNGSFFIGASANSPAGGYPGTADDDGQSMVDQAFLSFNGIPFDPTNLSSLYAMSALGYPTTVFILRTVGGAGDCNNNGIPDQCDVPPPCGNCEGPDCSQDCNGDCVPDECQLGCGDCNGNGRPDDCDIASGTSLDCNLNGIPDECDINPADPDCNGSTIPDCNGDGIPDDCQLDNNDCNNNGIPDDCDIANGTSCDCQPDGIPDECQIWVGGPRDILSWDDGSTENSLGLTAGGELCWMHHFSVANPVTVVGIQTSFGTPSFPGSSGVSAGQPVRVYVWSDPNGDGNPNDAAFLGESTGIVQAGSIDTDVPQEIAISQPVNSSFFVGASVVTTSGYPAPMDQNGPQYNQAWIVFNTVPFDPVNLGAQLYNMTDIGYACNFLLRANVYTGAPPNDCNENGVPDECDIGVEFGGYCSNPGAPCYPAECESDWNHNGVPDSCEVCGDIDHDGNVDIDDYWMFVDAFGTCVGDPKYNPDADMDGDGCVTLVDYQAWRMCYKMQNGKDFVAPKPKPMPLPKPAKNGASR
jgi:hypothetical protein